MSPTLPAVRCLLLLAIGTSTPSFAQDKQPPSAEPPKLAVSNQGKEKAPVEISIALRHTAPDAAACTASCSAADHWVVEIENIGHTPAGKPVTLSLAKQDAVAAELRSAGSRQAKKVGEVTISDATVSMRVPAQTPYAHVRQMLMTAATVGLHRIEFVVASAGTPAVERSLPMPLPVDGGAKPVLGQPNAGLERVRVNMRVDPATGQIVRKWGGNVVPAGVEGDAKMRESFATIMGDMTKFGLVDRSRVLIDAANDVPWQAVIEVVDIGLAAGFQGVQHWTGVAKK